MICISVTPESRKLAKVDILNASRQADMVELCLDHLVKPPDMKDILEGFDKPIIVSCRRKEDGGQYGGTEEQRMTLIREAIVQGPAYVELEMDVGLDVPRFGSTKRVISYTRTDKPLGNVDDIILQANNLNADIIKITWPTPTLDAAWPLLTAVTKKGTIPVVGMGLGRAGLTFSLLGRKYGSPWIYAALEKGMEGYDGQPTVSELNEIYSFSDIGPKTVFIGIVGFGESETTTIQIFNAALKNLGLNARCLPLAIGKFDNLSKMLDILKIKSMLTSRSLGEFILPLSNKREEYAESGQYCDLLLRRDDGWHAYNSIWRSAIKALEDTIGKSSPDDRPLDRRNVLVIGSGGLAQTMVAGINRRKGVVSVSARDDAAATKLSKQFDARFLPFTSLYDTLVDIVVFADPQMKTGHLRGQFNPSYLRESMTVIDVGTMPQDSYLITEARNRGCKVVEPSEVYRDQIAVQFKSIVGKELDSGIVNEILSAGE